MTVAAIKTAHHERLRGLAVELRALAEKADRGEIESFAAAWGNSVKGGNNWDFLRTGSDQETLVLADLLHDWAINRFKVKE